MGLRGRLPPGCHSAGAQTFPREFSQLRYDFLHIISSGGFFVAVSKKLVVTVECDCAEEQCVVANSQ